MSSCRPWRHGRAPSGSRHRPALKLRPASSACADWSGIPETPIHLEVAALDSATVALANAARETLHMGDMVEAMLADTLEVIQRDDRARAAAVAQWSRYRQSAGRSKGRGASGAGNRAFLRMVRDLRRIHSHLASFAYPVLHRPRTDNLRAANTSTASLPPPPTPEGTEEEG